MIRIKDKSVPPQVEEPIAPEMPVEEPPVDEGLIDTSVGSGVVDPEAARYMGPESRCHACIHFDGTSSCEVVAGPIDPEGVCMLFIPDTSSEPAEVPMDASAEEDMEPESWNS
jgi:hypothetical protein